MAGSLKGQDGTLLIAIVKLPTMFKSSITSLASRTPSALGRRAFHASPTAQKTVVEKVTEVADKVSRGSAENRPRSDLVCSRSTKRLEKVWPLR